MSDIVPVVVNCRRDGKLLAAYQLGYAVTLGPSALPSRETFISEAKMNLTNQGLAFPPYTGIQFEVVRQ